jgi:glycosyltransferase involved in cell wall biosynthesis
VIRVAICITNLEIGGAEVVLCDLLSRLPEDVEATVFTLIDGGPIAERISALGIEVVGLHMRRGVPSLGALIRLVRALRGLRPQIVHTWLYHADLLGGVAARVAGVPHVIWHLHNSDLSLARVSLSTRMVARVCAVLSRRVPDVILCCGEQVRTVHAALGYRSDRMEILHNGVDAERFAPSRPDRASVRQELGWAPGVALIGLVARLDPQKDHATFFVAARLLMESGSDASFILAGRGVDPSSEQVREWRDGLPHPDRVALLGQRGDVPRLMAALDIATSSSRGEAFPVSLLEAMACGVPCVVTDAGDSREIVGDTGVVVPPGDPAALADGWLRLLALPEPERRELGVRARGRVLAHYTIDEMAERCWVVYREVSAEFAAGAR